MEAEMTGRKPGNWEKIKDRYVIQSLKKRKTTLICLLFGIVALVQGLYYAFKLPFAQVPDEIAHYQMMEDEFGTSGYVDEMLLGVYYPAQLNLLHGNGGAKVDSHTLQNTSRNHFTKPLSISSFHPQIGIIRHLPCGIGFYLGIIMELPMLGCAYLAEIFSVLFYVGIGIAVIKIAPIKKDIFAFCMLMPMALQQCASVNYDSVLIPCSFLLFAYILKLFYSEDKIRWRNIFFILLLTFVLALIKPPYVLLALTLFIVPLRQYSLKIGKKFELMSFVRKYWFIVLPLIIGCICVGLYLLRNDPNIVLIRSDILEYRDFGSLLGRTFRSLGYMHIIQLVGMFGWLDSEVSAIFIILFFMMLTYLNCNTLEFENTKLNAARRIWLVVIFIAVFLMIEIAMQGFTYNYLEWNTNNIDMATYRSYIAQLPNILGVQGRYWIPILPVLLVGLSGPSQREHKKLYWITQIAFYALSFLYVMSILNVRYWS